MAGVLTRRKGEEGDRERQTDKQTDTHTHTHTHTPWIYTHKEKPV